MNPDAVIPILISGGIVGFITSFFLQGSWKIVGILFAFPFIFFVITAVQFGMTITDPSQLPSWVTWFVTNWIPFAIAFTGEALGVKAGKWLKARVNN